MWFFLGTHCGGRRCALPPAPPPPAFMFEPVPLATYSILFLISIVYLGSFYFLMFDIYRYLCLCTSFLARVAGGGAALPPHLL